MQKLVSAMPLLAACWVPPCTAYETDFHYGMTYWLSRTAGLDDAESRQVAIGNENRDQGMLDAKYAVIGRLCLLREKNASVYTHEAHFRAQKAPPAPRPDRAVVHTASFAGQGVENALAEKGTPFWDQLYRLGDALHGWQDTFSHEGVPSAVWPCPEAYVWSHPTDPAIESVPSNSHADVSHLRPKLCEQAAETTYVFIERFLAERRPELKPPPWSALQQRAGVFCGARTKTEKVRWFADNGVPEGRAIVKGTSMDNGPGVFRPLPCLDLEPKTEAAARGRLRVASEPLYARRPAVRLPATALQPQLDELLRGLDINAPAIARRFAEDFFRTWFVTPVPELPRAMAPFFGQSSLDPTGPQMQRLLRMRLEDRGSAQRPGVLPLSLPPAAVITAVPEQWRDVLVPARAGGQPPLVALLPDSKVDAMALAMLRHAPYEAVFVHISFYGDAPRIKDLFTVAVH